MPDSCHEIRSREAFWHTRQQMRAVGHRNWERTVEAIEEVESFEPPTFWEVIEDWMDLSWAPVNTSQVPRVNLACWRPGPVSPGFTYWKVEP